MSGTAEMSLEEVIRQALPLVLPDEEERRKAKEAEEELKKRLEEVVKPPLEFRFLGSYARNTWLKGSLEIDVFILFPEDTPKEELEQKGLEIGKAVVDEYELRYAAHPYVHGRVKGVEVDVVPCYRLRSPEKIKSAVDRTPFHHEWLKDRVKGKENDVRLLKSFLKAGGIYGAEYKVRGFSGYLCELLIVFYGSFIDVVRNAVKWTRNTVIDVAGGKVYRKKGLENILVIDPVDEKRNVAANLSVDNLARFVERCRDFLESPAIDFFIPEKPKVPDVEVLREELERRAIYAVEFEKPDIVEDNLYPQLERACKRVHEFLERNGFMPLRSSFFAGSKCYLFFEVGVRELSAILKRIGPPFEEEEHVKKFLRKRRKYAAFIEGGRYWVYSERSYISAREAIEDFIRKEWKSMGKNVGEMLSKGFKVLKGVELLEFEDPVFLASFMALSRKLRG
ncbi:CCA tRNA nucleotidyltransferase [Archaeoglobus veneficus]|uniref:CCA-adding enzyme n=1 Tax=Archaeoglobus veneficus (strain DSM 11195 / SNP6) TaxID=693661 RepID=F2KR20_ARCVS|nr:CCA tRNA nucleotidyltransferase [Archaeoglobus veneficus]AEA47826.1 CCA-adding enzyme [Archaeoglobus veneficus SNP6]